jgi:GntR family transcriptional regulator
MLNRSDPVPLYHQLKRVLVQRILSGQYGYEQAIPSERELIAQFGVSRMTVRMALQALVLEGLLRRERGRGSFVAAARLSRQADRLVGFEELAARGPVVIREEASRPVEPDMVPSSFTLAPGESVHCEERVGLLGEERVMHSMVYVKVPAGAAVTRRLFQEFRSVYPLMEQRFGIQIDHGSRTLEAVPAKKPDVARLGVKLGFPLLLVQTTVTDPAGRVVVFGEARYRSDRWRYVVPFIPRDAGQPAGRAGRTKDRITSHARSGRKTRF